MNEPCNISHQCVAVVPVDDDSKLSNLAAMKVAGWYQQQGHEVQVIHPLRKRTDARPVLPLEVQTGPPIDEVYIFCIFTRNAKSAKALASAPAFRNAKVHLGGTGIDLTTSLPDDIEHVMPAYGLFNESRAIGFTSRGCPNCCPFCVVPEKEGKKAIPWATISEFVPDDFSKVVLLDPNILATPRGHWKGIFEELNGGGLKVSLCQGIDATRITEEAAGLLADLMPYSLQFTGRTIYVAWDMMHKEKAVLRGIQHLIDAGVNPEHIKCYVLSNFDTTPAQDYYRFITLWKRYGVIPYMMPFQPLDGSTKPATRWHKAFWRHVNLGPVMFRNTAWRDYNEGSGATQRYVPDSGVDEILRREEATT